MYTAKLRYHAIAKHKFCINKTGGGWNITKLKSYYITCARLQNSAI